MALAIPIPQMGEMVIVLLPENLERMKNGDPFTIHLQDYGFATPLRITVCTEDKAGERIIASSIQQGDLKTAIDYLHRGWEHREGEDAIPPKKWSGK